MAEIVTMPKLGFDMAEGVLVRWVVSEGEAVQKGGILAEIETDKATVEVESNQEGVILRHLIDEGTAVPVGDPIAVIGAEGEDVDVDQLLPSEPGEKYAEETTPGGEGGPGSAMAPSAETGLRPDAPVRDQEALPMDTPVEEGPSAEAEEEAEDGSGDGRLPGGVRASPVARRMAEEQGIDLSRVKGSGPGGRIVKADIETYQEAAPPEPKVEERAPEPEPRPARAVFGVEREDRRIPLTRLRAAIGRRMTQAKQQVPHFYVTHEYDVAAMMDLRKQVNAMLPEEEKTSLNDYIVKATALTLQQFPNLNAALDEKQNEVIHFGHINIGIAVAVEGGLLTVVCRDADLKPIRQISVEARSMAERARQGKVRPTDIEGSTFSISNMGMFAVENFLAVINPPEAAILAVSSAMQVPVVENGELKPGMRMKATISVDHRVSDGAEAARFMQALEEYLEKPMLMLV